MGAEGGGNLLNWLGCDARGGLLGLRLAETLPRTACRLVEPRPAGIVGTGEGIAGIGLHCGRQVGTELG